MMPWELRRETGIQAQVLNEMLKVFEDMGRSEISAHDKLKEFVGHTPLQVLMGALLGILCGVVIYSYLKTNQSDNICKKI